MQDTCVQFHGPSGVVANTLFITGNRKEDNADLDQEIGHQQEGMN